MGYFAVLENGNEVKVCFRHNVVERYTEILLWGSPWSTTPKEAVICWAYVHPRDNFCKRTGRMIALKNLLRHLSSTYNISKNDRRTLFRAVFPEYDGITHFPYAEYQPKYAKVTYSQCAEYPPKESTVEISEATPCVRPRSLLSRIFSRWKFRTDTR